MNVSIAHDYLTQRGGAERVVLALCRAFPDATVYTALYDRDGTYPEFREQRISTLWLDRLAPLRRRHRLALPLLPAAWISSCVHADLVICSSSGWAHGVRTTGRKLVYCHSPAKWLYRPDDYLGDHPTASTRAALAASLPMLRRFDRWAASSADRYLANSTYTAEEVKRAYGIAAAVVPPPAGLLPAGAAEPPPGIEPGFLLTVARLLPYKNVTEVVEAFRAHDGRLIVVGEGPLRSQLSEGAPPNVRFLGEVDDAQLRWLYANCAGLIAASREDFGLTPIEAASFGKPVAALRWGGFLDTVVPGATGVFFDTATPEGIAAAVSELASRSWDPRAIRAHAETFSETHFIEEIQRTVQSMGAA